jgi:hypothetical protein
LYINTANLLTFSWILTIIARIWIPLNSLHRLALRLPNLSRTACVLLYLPCIMFSRDFTKLMRKANIKLMFFHPSVRLSVGMDQRDSHWIDFHEISLLLLSVDTFQFWSKSNKNNRHFIYGSAHMYNNIMTWFAFVIEISCDLC